MNNDTKIQTNTQDYWEKNNIKKPQQYVVCAACKCNDLIITSARHYDRNMNNTIRYLKEGVWIKNKVIQGFINQFGEFLTRSEAMILVTETGQPINIERNSHKTKLFSEGLY